MADPTNGDDVLNGTENDDRINGRGGNDTINGLGGNDVLNGGTGIDTLRGGNGNDIYIVDTAGDRAIETAANTHTPGGRDAVKSYISFALGNYVEDLFLLGTNAINANGNDLNNRLTGNSAANILNGRGGADRMVGGNGNDTYVVDNAGDLVIETNADRSVGGTDTVKSSVDFALGDNVERLTLIGGQDVNAIGNALANIITGNSGDNDLVGGEGNDVLRGGLSGDELTGGAGADRLVYGSAAESTSLNYDTIEGFNYEEDKVDLPVVVTGYDGVVESGRLDEDSFDADLAAAMAPVLEAGHAAFFAPSTGDLDGKLFLVVDGNGTAGYQSGEDFVFRVEDAAPPAAPTIEFFT
ncbi:MAG TPA: calcium-binding protein [Allosphingosinicella sp.]|nr:calcium-binding protein [Allosphingosinicella sp.]